MTRSILCLFLLCNCLPKSHSQIYVDSSNNVGIGSNVYSGAKQYLESGEETTALKIFSESGSGSNGQTWRLCYYEWKWKQYQVWDIELYLPTGKSGILRHLQPCAQPRQ